MAIEEMVLCKITFREDMLMDILKKLNSTQTFDPILTSNIVLGEDDSLLEEDETYQQLLKRVIILIDEMQLKCENTEEWLLNFDEVTQQLHQIENEYNKIKSKQRQFIFQKENIEKTLQMISYLDKDNVKALKACRFVMCQFGRLAKQKEKALSYSSKYPFLFVKVKEDQEFVWGYYVTNIRFFEQVEYIFHALKFEDIDIPDFVNEETDMIKKLEEKVRLINEQINEFTQKMTEFIQIYSQELQKMYAFLNDAAKLEEKRKYIVKNSSQCFVYGFIAKRLLESDALLNDLDIHYQTLPIDSLLHQDVEVPLVIHNAKFVKPFEKLSQIQGGDVTDITPLIAVMVSLIMGLFLGDLGVGISLLILGVIMHQKDIGNLFGIMGSTITVGGLMYGSLFYVFNLYAGLVHSSFYRVCDGICLFILGMTICYSFKKQDISIHKKFILIVVCVLGCYLLCLYETYINQLFMPVVFIVLFLVKKIMKK